MKFPPRHTPASYCPLLDESSEELWSALSVSDCHERCGPRDSYIRCQWQQGQHSGSHRSSHTASKWSRSLTAKQPSSPIHKLSFYYFNLYFWWICVIFKIIKNVINDLLMLLMISWCLAIKKVESQSNIYIVQNIFCTIDVKN